MDSAEPGAGEDSNRLEAEDRFAKIFRLSPVAIAICNADNGIFVDVNPAFLRLFGYEREELIGRSALDFGFKPISEENADIEQDLRDEGSLANVELTFATRGGTPVEVLVSLELITLAGQACVLAIGFDVTERRRAERALRRMASIVESSPDAIIGMTPEGVIHSWNTGAERIYGYSAAEMLGSTTHVILPPESRDALDATLAEVRALATVRQFETHHLRKDGSLAHISFTVLPLVDRRGRVEGISTIARDITEKVALESRLAQSQKMDAIGRLAGGIAHDFNNMLTVILSYCDLLLSRVGADNPLRDMIAQIENAARRSAALTRQLLVFSRKQILRPKLVDLNTIVADLTRLLDRLLGEDIELVSRLDPQLWQTTADPSQMEQVIVNLAVNARDAMPHGGRLTLRTRNVVRDDRRAKYVELRVSDTGVGMDEATRACLFEPFFTTKEAGKGTGLGLATVHGIVAQSGGFIEVRSRPGEGADFDVLLPATSAAGGEPCASHEKAKLPAGSETVLLVEDEPVVRELAKALLESHGFQVLEAASGSNALAIVRSGAQIALVLTDVVMAGMSGRQLADLLRTEHPNIKVLFMSGYTDDAIVRRGAAEAGIRIVEKPFTPLELIRAVRGVLDASAG